ncbi:uncharacterized protein LOC124382793 [Silurus meridionalis]|uniref:uncharacterized protein LOC124382793 n=1 Tax=Silurus meridionalis TaxID=175797 RepID=UPI001EEA3575|nr:uncharacterized protein LOC124382793 [Silurus meridionalis]
MSQVDDFPRHGSFKTLDMENAYSMVNGGWGDPNWDYTYMRESYDKWVNMKKYWDKGPERVNASKCSLNKKQSPPPYNSTPSTSPGLYPALPVAASLQPAFAFVRERNEIHVKPAKASDIDAICRSLPIPTNPTKYVQILKSHTRYAQLTGPDFRTILLRTLGDDVTEELIIEKCPTLAQVNDAITGEGTAANRHQIFWENDANVMQMYNELKDFLDNRIASKRDISHAANTKQGFKETPSAFVVRFKAAWENDSKLPTDDTHNVLFINTCLNNMKASQAQLIRITTDRLLEK